ncbi:MAG: hypothetical protein NT027_14565 [Proteobacteria bacterium]|nr:hypothetical protein [Pseudomonadota bacterium]
MKFYRRFLLVVFFLSARSGMGAVTIEPIKSVALKVQGVACIPVNLDEAYLSVNILAEDPDDQSSFSGHFYGVNQSLSSIESLGDLVFSMNECQINLNTLVGLIAKPILVDGVIKTDIVNVYEDHWAMCPVRRMGDTYPCYKGQRLVSKTKRWTLFAVDNISLLNVSHF